MGKIFTPLVLFPICILALLTGCNDSRSTVPLSADNVNLIFVSSPDLAYHTTGDIKPDTANLTDQGLHRSLLMAPFLKQQVLGGKNATAIYTLTPMTHLQTDQGYPDMAAIWYMQQFALLNQFTLPVDAAGTTYTALSYPLYSAYAPGSVPSGVAVPGSYCPDCAGLDFNNTGGNNDALVSGIITGKKPGYYVFSAPWETISALMTQINRLFGYNLNLPSNFMGSNAVYAISIAPGRSASLFSYDTNLDPSASYPPLPSPVATGACPYALQPRFSTVRTGGVDGAVIPADINKNQKIYIIRHAEAHPDPTHRFEDGNYVGAGQWRALALPNALRDKINPDMVLSIDPGQWAFTGAANIAYVRPSLTIMPYAVANNLPYYLVSSFELGNPDEPRLASNYLFTGGAFSNKTILLAWESSRIKPLINALLSKYGGSNLSLLPTAWPSADYDTIWTVTLDALGNVTVDNDLCEGIDSAGLPATAPQY
ncbi:hypothetical protein [Citrifermentans bemidjiense]|uniref:hypothetical protein n=1 Tax=Citrifermentans bemidjiense TaxID=225194 RepID=UPI0011D16F26|nr:hypothetical protein [Citrifermentans bemidjiense]